MAKTLKELINLEQSPKNVDIEIQEFLRYSLDEVLLFSKIEFFKLFSKGNISLSL